MAAPSRAANVGLYRQLLRAAQTFSQYNFRDYASRYVRDDFRAAVALQGDEVRRLPVPPSSSCACAPGH
tara:strand:+ start:45 stop:251 length:207 start_codon:yes stop_codon:yes gene_type:complete